MVLLGFAPERAEMNKVATAAVESVGMMLRSTVSVTELRVARLRGARLRFLLVSVCRQHVKEGSV